MNVKSVTPRRTKPLFTTTLPADVHADLVALSQATSIPQNALVAQGLRLLFLSQKQAQTHNQKKSATPVSAAD